MALESCGSAASVEPWSYSSGPWAPLKGSIRGPLKGSIRGPLKGSIRGPLKGSIKGPLKGSIRFRV